jgi:hypothetical protein
VRSTNTISIPQATTSVSGFLSSTDWNTFNNKVSSQWTTSGSNIYYNLGNIGIGTTSPSSDIHINGGPSFATSIRMSSADNVVNGFLISKDIGDNIILNQTENKFLAFATNNNERMRILTGGNIGIGTATPSYALDVAGNIRSSGTILGGNSTDASRGLSILNSSLATAGSIFACFGKANTARNQAEIQYVHSGGDGSTSNRLTLGLHSIQVLHCLGSGNVGIGTATPNAPLQFANTTVNRKIVLWETANNDNEYYGFGVNSGTLRYQVPNSGAHHIFFAGGSSTTSNELMRIQGNGNVGIGLTGPSSRLHVVNDTAGADNLAIFSNANSGVGTRADLSVRANNAHVILSSCSSGFTGNASFGGANGCSVFTNVASSGGLSIASRATSGVIRFYTGGDNERMRILSTGQVCVNTTTSVGNTQCTINGVASCQFLRQTAPLASFWDRNGNQVVANASVATITWNRTQYGTSLLTWNLPTNAFVNNQTYSILLNIQCTASWAGVASGFRVLFFDHSVYGRLSFSDIPHNGTEFVGQNIQTQILMPAGSSISTKVFHTRGSNLDLVNSGVAQTQLFFTEIPLSG